MAKLGGILRPHVKTHKSIDVMRKVLAGGNLKGITVSTLHEANYFFKNGVADILYAVSIAPNKLEQVHQLMASGCDLKIILDSLQAAQFVIQYGKVHAITFKVLIELDTDDHRSGVKPEGSELIDIAKVIDENEGAELLGVMTHAGESYACNTPESRLNIARQERDRSLHAAQQLKQAKLPCPVVSIGSTPTAFAIDELNGITEVRAGVYTFFDLVMAGIGVCKQDNIALSVLSSVIGYQHEKGWVITDSGWMSLSRDRGTSNQAIDYKYGVVCDAEGQPIKNLVVSNANQEHGIVSKHFPSDEPLPDLPIGSLLRILPNHACSTSSQYEHYYVVDGDQVIGQWQRTSGW